jgi:prepilin-type N-terminal cleavage/methylation domain-containing protein
MKPKNKKGFTLVELLIVLAVGALMVFGAFTLVGCGAGNNNADDNSTQEVNSTQ